MHFGNFFTKVFMLLRNLIPSTAGYECECRGGWDGGNCEYLKNECLSDPCVNDGTCLDKKDYYECVCTSGWEGYTTFIILLICFKTEKYKFYSSKCTVFGWYGLYN